MTGLSVTRPAITIVVAAVEAVRTAAASVARFAAEVDGRGEVLLVDGSTDGTADRVASLGLSHVQVLRRPPGRLVPELWRDGLNATKSPLVALSTAQMLAAPGWLDGLLAELDATGAAVVGGPIEPAARLSALDRAMYLLRYVPYARPLSESVAVEPPGDNALYRRDALDAVEPSWSRGFWETEVHRALRGRGERVAMAADAVVRFHGGSGLTRSARQRHRHAWHYGSQRGARMGTVERLGRTATAPAVPWVLLHRIAATLAAKGDSIVRWGPALPWLGVLLTAWSTGETFGIWSGGNDHEVAAA